MWGCNYFPYFSWSGSLFPGGILFALILLFTLVLLVCLVLKFIRTIKSDKTQRNRDRYDSFKILKARYARGDISEKEFIKMKNFLLQS